MDNWGEKTTLGLKTFIFAMGFFGGSKVLGKYRSSQFGCFLGSVKADVW